MARLGSARTGMARPVWALLLATLALAGCQAGGFATRQPAPQRPPDPTDGLAAIPPCPTGLVARLNTGVTVAFAGAVPDRPETCLRRVNGHTYRYFLGFWGDGTFHDGTAAERAAIRKVLTGPVGTSASFPLRTASAVALWRSATITHVGDPTLSLGHGTPRPTMLLLVERRTDAGRDVHTETLWWLDRATLVPLQREEVIPMTHGTERQLAWRVRALAPASD